MRALLILIACGMASLAAQDVLTWHNDNARTGQNLAEKTLNLENVNPKTFGKLFVIDVDGKVDAEPLYVHSLAVPDKGLRNVLFVGTEHDSMYAFDADSGEPFWHTRLLHSGETPSDSRNCSQIAPNGEEGAIWQSGAGPAADLEGNIYFLSANGTFDTKLNRKGFPSLGDFGNSFLKISLNGGRLSIADYFTPFNVLDENKLDMDLGSGGPIVLPEMRDASGKIRRLVVSSAKDRNIYLLDREALGKFNPHGNQAIYQEVEKVLKGRYYRGQPTYFDGRLYFPSVDDYIREFKLANARIVEEPVSHTSIKFPYPGASPSISADGSRNGILWAIENLDRAVLHAYDANDLSHELYNSDDVPSGRDHFGAGNKFITPMIANGKVYVGTTNGLGVFGLR